MDYLQIGRRRFSKNSSGVFEVPLADLSTLTFTEVPYYSTVEVAGLPGAPASYRLSISATHAGGPHNEDFSLVFHVNFRVAGSGQDSQTVSSCYSRRRRVRRYFSEVAAQLQLSTGPDVVPYFEDDDSLLAIVTFSRSFERTENPTLLAVIDPFVTRFVEFLKTKDVLLFLCHASEDKPFVDRLCAFLDSQEVTVWYDRREIKVGDSIVRRINDGLGSASHLVVVLSGASVAKPWVLKEMSAALMRQLQNAEITVLPLLIESCTVPPLLADIKFADCREDPDAGFRELIMAVS